MDISAVKNVSPNKHLVRKIVSIVTSIVVIIVSYIILTNANKAAQDTIEVLRVKAKEGLPAYTVISEKNIEKYRLIKKEYTQDMVPASELSSVINKLNKYYIRQNSILYKDQFTDEKPKKNQWLYKLDEDYEVVTIPYNYLECGGDVLLPGDRVRIRVSYQTDDSFPSENEGNPNIVTMEKNDSVVKTEVIFDSIMVMDMLNANSHSIYEVYTEVMKLSTEKQDEVMKNQEFKNSIKPRALLLAGTKEQINNYAKYKSADANSFLFTILSRANREVIIDELPAIESEVQSWIEN